MKRMIRRENVLLLITLAILALPFVAGAMYVQHKHQWAQERLDELEPRHARLLGLEASRDSLVQAQTQAQSMMAQYAYPVEQDSNQAGNEAQQRVRSILAAAGLDIASSQALEAKEDRGFERTPLAVRAEGDMVAVQAALAGLAEQMPAILIDDVAVRSQGGAPVKGVQRQYVQLSLSVLRRQP